MGFMTSQSRVIEAMQSWDFYPHETEGSIRLIQTHSAYVLLTGPFAYKIKKAVKLPFLDFSTIELRRHFCHEEIRLNRNFGSTLYEKVVTIVERDDGFALEEGMKPTAAVEYAVRMRQFEQSDLLLERLRAGRMDIALAVELARKVAAIHATAQTSGEIANLGGVESVRAVVEENFESVRPYLGRTESTGRFERGRDSILGFLRDHADLFESRRRDGFVRECHGDLHLNNICIVDGQIEFFDCLDFSAAFRNIDVMYELAFLVMDLEYYGAAGLANVLMNTYIEETGDYEGAVLLPIYMHMRAYVRGKVASLALDEPEIPAEQRHKLMQSAEAHFVFADRILERPRPRLVVMCGVSGSGKSFVASEIARAIGAIHVRTDAVRKQLRSVPLRRRSSEIYDDETTRETYARLYEHARRLLQFGLAVVLDGTYAKGSQRSAAARIARELGAPFNIVQCTASKQALTHRIASRNEDVSDATPGLLDEQLQHFEPLSPDELPHSRTINSADAAALQRLISELSSSTSYGL